MKHITNLEEVHQMIVNKRIVFTLFIIIFFAKNTIYCQSLEEIKKSDTVYIYFDKIKENTNKYKPFKSKSDFYKNILNYKFSTDSYNSIIFSSNTYKNFDDFERGIKNDERIEKKSFLKKNKDIILDIDFFIENGFKETFFEIYKKTIYLIDKDDMKGRKIKIKQVEMMNFTYFEE
jgi:hypothetical protein